MSHNSLGALLRQVRAVSFRQASSGLSDGDLLERFLRERYQAAFEVLVWRHGKMVLGVCQRLLRHAQDAEDAFQATFLILVRKGSGISRHESLGPWLHRVAYRVALRAAKQTAKRRITSNDIEEATGPVVDEVSLQDLRPVLDEEIGRLPEKCRAVVLLCYLAGHSTAEAAGLLGIPRGTVLTRLATARQRLQQRLRRRGITLTASVLSVALAEAGLANLAAEQVRTALLAADQQAAGTLATSGVVSPQTVSLTEGVVRSMGMSKVKIVAILVVLAILTGLGLGRWTLPPEASAQDKPRPVLPDSTADSVIKLELPPKSSASAAMRPVGQWERQIGPMQISLDIEPERLIALVQFTERERRVKVRLEADYHMTKDYVLYGVITSIDLEYPAEQPNDTLRDYGEVMRHLNGLLDHPFSVRLRTDDNALTIKDINLGGFLREKKEKNTEEEAKMFILGRYKKSDGMEKPFPQSKKK